MKKPIDKTKKGVPRFKESFMDAYYVTHILLSLALLGLQTEKRKEYQYKLIKKS